MTNEDLINDLVKRVKTDLNNAEELLQLNADQLNNRPNPKAWNSLECLEHLNNYGNFYIPEITKRLDKAAISKSDALFNSGMLGDYFAKSMLPKQNLNKMSTFKSMNPIGSNLNKSTIERFIVQQKQMLNLLARSRTVNLNRTKTSISISSLIKLRLGDALRVVIYHNNRHIIQAQKAVENFRSARISD